MHVSLPAATRSGAIYSLLRFPVLSSRDSLTTPTATPTHPVSSCTVLSYHIPTYHTLSERVLPQDSQSFSTVTTPTLSLLSPPPPPLFSSTKSRVITYSVLAFSRIRTLCNVHELLQIARRNLCRRTSLPMSRVKSIFCRGFIHQHASMTVWHIFYFYMQRQFISKFNNNETKF